MAASMDVHTREAQHRAVYSKQIFSILLHSKTCVYSIACAKPNHYCSGFPCFVFQDKFLCHKSSLAAVAQRVEYCLVSLPVWIMLTYKHVK